MADSLLEILNEVRSQEQCDEHDVRKLITVAGSMRELYRLLLHEPRPENRPIVIQLLKYETKEHEQHDGLSQHLIICSYLLARHGYVEDCLLIWEAKIANFSTFLGVNDVLLVSAGIDETICFLRNNSPKQRSSYRSLLFLNTPVSKSALSSAAALEHIEKALNGGRFVDREREFEEIKRFCQRSLAIE